MTAIMYVQGSRPAWARANNLRSLWPWRCECNAQNLALAWWRRLAGAKISRCAWDGQNGDNAAAAAWAPQGRGAAQALSAPCNLVPALRRLRATRHIYLLPNPIALQAELADCAEEKHGAALSRKDLRRPSTHWVAGGGKCRAAVGHSSRGQATRAWRKPARAGRPEFTESRPGSLGGNVSLRLWQSWEKRWAKFAEVPIGGGAVHEVRSCSQRRGRNLQF